MAADKITIDLDLNARRATREIAQLQKKIDTLGRSMTSAFRTTGGGGSGDKVRALGTGLSKATVRADEFTKSLEASNARVIAFGASAGLIMQVDRALKAMVVSAVKVEKAMMDVNVVMNASVKTLERFGKGMFDVAKSTAQSFDTVAEAATELARQGLGMEKTLQRTKDALILTRLTGMNAADSVKALTAAVNSFNKEGATSAKILNTMAKVDAAYAVSSEDLANAISRVGASAQSAGVNMNELMAITTAVQQRTARGGAVIGNAFKTIFTRIQRSDVQKRLRDFGIAATDMQGRMLSGMKVLENMAAGFDNLTKAQQASLAENVAGVFQVNILKAALADLSQETSNYRGSLREANSATDEAYKRNEQLNQTLDALASRTLTNLTKAGAALGGGMFEPAIRKVLGTVNATIEAFGKGGSAEGLGETMGKGLMAGIGNFISGPGLALVIAAFTKLALNLGKFATTAMKDFMGLNNVVKQRAGLEQMVIEKLKSEPQYIQQIINKEKTLVQVEREMLSVMELQTLERAQMAAIAAPVAKSMYQRGARVTPTGYGAFGMGSRPGTAGGFIPNFASAGAERAAAAAGGYTAGAIKTMNQPGVGSVMYNSAETVKHFPGMSQAAIMPPKNSPAGAGYKAAFDSAHGFNPYAASGFVPNFKKTKSAVRERKVVDASLDATGDMAVIMAQAGSSSPLKFTNTLDQIPGLQKELLTSGKYKQLVLGDKQGRALDFKKSKLRIWGMPQVSMFPMTEAEAADHAAGQGGSTIKILQKSLDRYKEQVAERLFTHHGEKPKNTDDFNINHLSKGTAGDIFEEALRAASGAGDIDRRAAFDFSGNRYAPKPLTKFMRDEGANISSTKSKVEAKIGKEAAADGNLPKKVFNDAVSEKGEKLGITKMAIFKELAAAGKFQLAAGGFVPNFSLVKAINRETSAGVPASAVRIASHSSLKSAGNPAGLGVYNTIDEPRGLTQGINRARSMGMNPKTHGAARGFVPNFMVGSDAHRQQTIEAQQRAAEKMEDASELDKHNAEKSERAANRLMMASMVFSMAAPGISAGVGAAPSTQAGISAGSNILSMAGMGAAMTAGTGPGMAVGALGGAAVGAIMSYGDLSMAFGEQGRRADAQKAKEDANAIVEGLGKVQQSLMLLAELPFKQSSQRILALVDLTEQLDEVQRSLLEGGAGNEGAMDAFVKARATITNREEFEKLSPKEQERVLARTSQLIQETRDRAQSVLSGGSQAAYDAQIAKINEQAQGARAGKSLLEQFPDAHRDDVERAMKAQLDYSDSIRTSFNPRFQEKISELPALMGPAGIPDTGTTGKNMLQRYQEQMERGEGRAAAKTLADLFGRIPEGQKMAASLNQALNAYQGTGIIKKGSEAIFGISPAQAAAGNLYGERRRTLQFRDKDFTQAATLAGKGGPGSLAGGIGRGAYSVINMLTAGRARNMLPMFDPTITDPAELKETPAQKATREELERASKVSLTPGIRSSIAAARRSGYAMQSGLAGTKRGLQERGARRAGRVSLNAAGGLFGEGLIEANKRIAEEGLMDTYLGALDDAETRRSGALDTSKNKTRATYLEALQKADIGTDERNVAAMNLSAIYEDMNLDEMRKELEALKTSPTQSKTDSIAITLLGQRIKDADDATAAFDHSVRQAKEDLDSNSVKLNENTQSQKEILEASKEFYSGKHFDNLRTERSILQGRIVMEKDLVKEGKMNAEQLEKSKERLRELNLTLDGVNTTFIDTMKFLRGREGKPLSDIEAQDAGAAAGQALYGPIRQRTRSAEGNRKILRDADRLFKEGKITAEQYRGVLQGSRADDLSGNPMKDFREQFLYGGRDHMLEFRQGVVGVANTMKSSFADAFKSISSGAATGKEAIVAFADSILNSISDVSANMATNMMFSKFFGGAPQNAQGGYIPRYQGGGLVTGGSGVKDDVPALMSGGEYVIRKSAVNKIGLGTLNAINGYSTGGSTGGQSAGNFSGMDVAKFYGVSAAASMASGYLNRPAERDTPTFQNYGKGRSELGYLGGADPDAGGTSSISGGGNRASVSLNKAFVYYRRDPVTGQLVSERARPTEGRFETSSLISTMGLLREDDPQTARMFSKEEKMANYQQYLFTEKKRRSDIIKAHNKQKRGRMMSAYMNAAMLVGGQAFMGGAGDLQGSVYSRAQDARMASGSGSWNIGGGMAQKVGNASGGAIPRFGGGGRVSPAMLMGGEYVMSPDAVRTYGVNFMSELNRGSVPGYANGGLVGGGAPAGSGINTNNVKININIDKSGNAEIGSSLEASQGDNADDRDINNEVENNKKMAEMLQGVVLKTITDQQRPGGLLQNAKP